MAIKRTEEKVKAQDEKYLEVDIAHRFLRRLICSKYKHLMKTFVHNPQLSLSWAQISVHAAHSW